MTTAKFKPEERAYQPFGSALELFYSHDGEVVLSGPAGTGKSRACLEKLHRCAMKYAGMRGLILRKTRASLTESALVTFEEKVLPVGSRVAFGPDRAYRKAYHYPNKSELVVGGLDNPDKVMSAEYDIIYIQEAIEASEKDWEYCTTRLRNGVIPYAQLIADTNPDAPSHWLYRRSSKGQTRLIESRHEENPTVTADYLARLDCLTGVRYQRLRLGLWVAAEGMVYEGWDPAVHRVDRFPIPANWPRYWSCDFGYNHPLVIGCWAVDPDGRLFCYKQLFQTGTLVEDAARLLLQATKDDPKPRAIICDHDAEDRATLERHLNMRTVAAFKGVSPGIQAVASRLRVAGDGRARIFFLRDSVIKRDASLDDKKRPTCTEEEFEGYVWDLSNNRKKGEEPVKLNDDGCDMTRYMVAHIDSVGKRPQKALGW